MSRGAGHREFAVAHAAHAGQGVRDALDDFGSAAQDQHFEAQVRVEVDVQRGEDRRVVLGLVTTKTGELESKDLIKRRIDEAAKYVDIDQLCLSPQCGFASTEEGNTLTEEAEWDKMRMIKAISQEVWG